MNQIKLLKFCKVLHEKLHKASTQRISAGMEAEHETSRKEMVFIFVAFKLKTFRHVMNKDNKESKLSRGLISG